MSTPLFVCPEQLDALRQNTGVVAIDCRFSLADPEEGRRLYLESHIPGAFYLHLNEDLSSSVATHGGRHPLPTEPQFNRVMQSVGADNDSTIVIYDDHRLGFAARLWWLLRWFGHENVHVLDGGFSAWQRSGFAVEKQLPESRKGQFQRAPSPEMVVDYGYVKSQAWDGKSHVLIDSRERPRFLGEQEPIDPIAGCIPGAINLPWLEFTNSDGNVQSPSFQQERLASIAEAEELVVYCGSGVTACVNLLSLFCIGREDAKLYSGSWSDWCSYL